MIKSITERINVNYEYVDMKTLQSRVELVIKSHHNQMVYYTVYIHRLI